MDTRPLGSLQVSLAGLGCNQIGSTCDAATSASIFAAALDHGINYFDTADEYGDDGRSEEFLGKAVRGRRDKVVIATKFGMRLDDNPLREGASARWIAIAVEDSLRRLGTDYIDLYQLHFPDPKTPIEETLAALDRLVKAGKVREIGCCNLSAAQIDEAAEKALAGNFRSFVSVQHRLNLLRQEKFAEAGPACRRHNMHMLPYYPLASGTLTGKYQRGKALPPGSRLRENVDPETAQRILSSQTFDRLEALEGWARDHGRTIAELAVAWLASQPIIASVICGATRPQQVIDNAKATAWTLNPAELAEVAMLGRGTTS
jgi:aryl-alcohol dehydrogenase-like predicted oxidoreductase